MTLLQHQTYPIANISTASPHVKGNKKRSGNTKRWIGNPQYWNYFNIISNYHTF